MYTILGKSKDIYLGIWRHIMFIGLNMNESIQDFIDRKKVMQHLVIEYLSDREIYIGDRKAVFLKALEADLLDPDHELYWKYLQGIINDKDYEQD